MAPRTRWEYIVDKAATASGLHPARVSLGWPRIISQAHFNRLELGAEATQRLAEVMWWGILFPDEPFPEDWTPDAEVESQAVINVHEYRSCWPIIKQKAEHEKITIEELIQCYWGRLEYCVEPYLIKHGQAVLQFRAELLTWRDCFPKDVFPGIDPLTGKQNLRTSESIRASAAEEAKKDGNGDNDVEMNTVAVVDDYPVTVDNYQAEEYDNNHPGGYQRFDEQYSHAKSHSYDHGEHKAEQEDKSEDHRPRQLPIDNESHRETRSQLRDTTNDDVDSSLPSRPPPRDIAEEIKTLPRRPNPSVESYRGNNTPVGRNDRHTGTSRDYFNDEYDNDYRGIGERSDRDDFRGRGRGRGRGRSRGRGRGRGRGGRGGWNSRGRSRSPRYDDEYRGYQRERSPVRNRVAGSRDQRDMVLDEPDARYSNNRGDRDDRSRARGDEHRGDYSNNTSRSVRRDQNEDLFPDHGSTREHRGRRGGDTARGSSVNRNRDRGEDLFPDHESTRKRRDHHDEDSARHSSRFERGGESRREHKRHSERYGSEEVRDGGHRDRDMENDREHHREKSSRRDVADVGDELRSYGKSSRERSGRDGRRREH